MKLGLKGSAGLASPLPATSPAATLYSSFSVYLSVERARAWGRAEERMRAPKHEYGEKLWFSFFFDVVSSH